MKSLKLAFLLLFFGLAALAPWGARADDHDRARAVREKGDVLPLRQILENVERDFLGDVIEVELESDSGQWVYEVKLITPEGAVMDLDLDAQSGAVIKAEGHDVDHARRRRDDGGGSEKD